MFGEGAEYLVAECKADRTFVVRQAGDIGICEYSVTPPVAFTVAANDSPKGGYTRLSSCGFAN